MDVCTTLLNAVCTILAQDPLVHLRAAQYGRTDVRVPDQHIEPRKLARASVHGQAPDSPNRRHLSRCTMQSRVPRRRARRQVMLLGTPLFSCFVRASHPIVAWEQKF
eukprot:1335654-Pleurochrysis_carterae.AAC.4